MSIYDELTARVSVPNRPDGAAEGRRFWSRRIIVGILAGIACVAFILIVMLVTGRTMGLGTMVLIILLSCLIVVIIIKRRVDPQIFVMLNDDCDPEGFMASMAAALRKCPVTTMSIDFVFSYGSGALCAGYFDQAAIVGRYLHELSTRPGMKRNHVDRALFHETILYVELSLAMMDEDALTTNLVALSQLSDAHPYWMTQNVRSRLEYSTFLKLYHDQNWDLLISGLKSYKFPFSCRRYEVKRNYYLYRVYRLKGDDASAAAARDFVLANGGGLWYRTKLLSEGAGSFPTPVS